MSDRRIEIYPETNPAAPLAVYRDLMEQYGIETIMVEFTIKGQWRITEIRAINKAVAEAFNAAVCRQLGPDFACHGLMEK